MIELFYRFGGLIWCKSSSSRVFLWRAQTGRDLRSLLTVSILVSVSILTTSTSPSGNLTSFLQTTSIHEVRPSMSHSRVSVSEHLPGHICEAEREDDHALNLKGLPHNPYNGVMCNDTITATGVFSSKELWKFSKGKGNRPFSCLIFFHFLMMIFDIFARQFD